jgi:hypothetical protein
MCAANKKIRKYHPKNRGMLPQAIKTQDRSQDEPTAEIDAERHSRATDNGDLSPFSGSFLALNFFCSQAESTLRPHAGNTNR